MASEDFLTLYVDPGEDTGWCIARGFELLAAGTEKMWPFADEVWQALTTGRSALFDPSYLRDGVDALVPDFPAWEDRDVSYLAGLVDGEGCISVSSRGENREVAQFSIGMTTPEPLQWAHETFGGTIGGPYEPTGRGTKQMWHWRVSAQAELQQLLVSLLPHLKVKREAAEKGLAVVDAQLSRRRGTRIGRIVTEDFRIYPWKAKDLAWDRVRTARLIGALTFMARLKGIPFVLQPAAVKPYAVAAGAEEFYYKPLHENRHQNDAIQHYVFYINTELRGNKVVIPDGHDKPDHHPV